MRCAGKRPGRSGQGCGGSPEKPWATKHWQLAEAKSAPMAFPPVPMTMMVAAVVPAARCHDHRRAVIDGARSVIDGPRGVNHGCWRIVNRCRRDHWGYHGRVGIAHAYGHARRCHADRPIHRVTCLRGASAQQQRCTQAQAGDGKAGRKTSFFHGNLLRDRFSLAVRALQRLPDLWI